MTVGIAVAAYSSTLLALCLASLGLWRTLIPLLAWLVLGLVVQVSVSMWVGSRFAYPYGMAADALMIALLWLALVALAPPLRDAGAPVLSRVPVLRKLL